jgi:hypothetical protein
MEALIAAILAHKTGDGEFILSGDPTGRWFAAAGNKSKNVCMGEQIAYGHEEGVDFYAEGASAREALERLYALVAAAGCPGDKFNNVLNFGHGDNPL